MSVRKIVTAPNKILDKPCQKVSKVTAEIKSIIKDMQDTLATSETPGAGIAANQIGVDKHICIVRDFYPDENGEEELFTEYVLINPEIKIVARRQALDWEGCLSVPDTFGLVKRHKKIKVEAMNESGKIIRLTAEGFLARTLEHEIDHLNGVLFTSKIMGNTKTEEELDAMYSRGRPLG